MSKNVPIGTSWQGMDGEDEMSDKDWHQRGHEQASCLVATGDIELSSPDSSGTETGGCYNGDYTQEQHDAANASLSDEYVEAEFERDLSQLFGAQKSK